MSMTAANPRIEKKKEADSVQSSLAPKKTLVMEMKALVTNIPFMLALFLTIVFSYGFSIAHNSISTDDFTAHIYYPLNGEMVAQGRFTIVILANLFDMMKNVPYFCDVLSVVLFAMAAMLYCIFFDRAMGGKLSMASKTIFSCLLVSYPLINEIYVYGGGNVNVCLGYVMTAAALLLYQQWYSEKKKLSLLWLFIDLFFVVSLYESFAVVFLCGVIMLFILNFYYNPADADRGHFGKVFVKGLVAIGILGAACLVEFAAGEIVLWALDIPASENAATDIWWFSEEMGVPEVVVRLISDLVLYFYVAAAHYLPIKILCACFVLCVVFMFASWIKNRNFTIGALFFALFFMQFFLTLLAGRLAPGRNSQYYAFFVAFLIMLLFERLNGFFKETKKIKKETLRKILSVSLGCVAFWLVFIQAYDLNNWLCLDVQRSEEEVAAARAIGDELNENYDVQNKPVLFIGKYEISETIREQCTITRDDPRVQKAAKFFYDLGLYQIYSNIGTLYDNETYKFVRSNLNSYLYWATCAFEQPNQEIMRFYRYLGYNFHTVDTYDQYKRYVPLNLIMPGYPEKGYITEEEGVIVVCLGKIVDLSEQQQQMGELSGADN